MFNPGKLAHLLEAPCVPIKADPFSLDALIAWLRTKPSGKSYDWEDRAGNCLLCQYIKSVGLDASYPRGYSAFVDASECGRQTTQVIALDQPHTFGAALTRALAIKARQS